MNLNESQDLECMWCGSAIQPDDLFCAECGKLIITTTSDPGSESPVEAEQLGERKRLGQSIASHFAPNLKGQISLTRQVEDMPRARAGKRLGEKT